MPVFETDEERTYFVTTIYIHPDFLTSNEARNERRNEVANEDLTDNEQLVMNAMQMDSSITIAKMVTLLGLPKTAIDRAIKSLKEKNKIRREGATKNGKWIVTK